MTIIVVSDIHLGYSNSNSTDFENFLDNIANRSDVDTLVILGDLFDMWRADVSGLFLKFNNTTSKIISLSQRMKVYCIAGNHDYHMLKLASEYPIHFQSQLVFSRDGITYKFLHGWEFDPAQHPLVMELLCQNMSDQTGQIRSDASATLQNVEKEMPDSIKNISDSFGGLQQYLAYLMMPPSVRLKSTITDIEQRARQFVGRGEMLVFGHTHRPFVSSDKILANCGSWVIDEPIHNTYVEIEGNELYLMQYGVGGITERVDLSESFEQRKSSEYSEMNAPRREPISSYDKALEINPNDAVAWFQKGVALSDIGRNEEAIVCYDKALELDPNNVDTLYNKGLALSMLRKYEEAISSFDMALELDPNNVDVLKNKLLAQNGLGRSEVTSEIIVKPSAHTASDKWVLEDNLGYVAYAEAIYSFITHKETKPPLAISIQAPWGGGKTSIMRMIQNKLDPDALKLTTDKQNSQNEQPKTSVKEIITELKEKTTDFKITSKNKPEKLTVWFNPWKYQNAEQIWAGLAHAIISQISERLSDKDREKFFLQLNLNRVGKEEVNRRIRDHFFSSWWQQIRKWMWTYLSGVGISAVTAYLGTLKESLSSLQQFGKVGVILSVVAGAAVTGVQQFNANQNVRNDEPRSVLGEFVQIPNYKRALGFVHHVDEDLQRVFKIIENYLPLIIFIDDLDRCSPSKVAEVVEAINMFISAEYSQCIFVIGMDMELVSAALEESYSKVIERLPNYSKQSSIGWKFMDKFVQLPVIIPPPDDENIKVYVNSLLIPLDKDSEESKLVNQIANDIESQKDLIGVKNSKELEKIVENSVKSDDKKNELRDAALRELLARVYKKQMEKVTSKINEAKIQYSDQSPEIQSVIAKSVIEFSDNPREMKRFLNVLRFNYFIREGRKEIGLPHPTLDQLRRWIILTLKWPQLTIWLQHRSSVIEHDYESRENFTVQKLMLLEEYSGKSTEDWKTKLREMLQVNSNEEIPWINDENLKLFFERESVQKDKLSDAAYTGLY